MTVRLYYTNPHEREFDATVIHVERRAGQTLVRLDRTAFYPTSGGQPFDTGTLGASRVVDVRDDDEGDVVHVLETGGLRPGDRVHGCIDWPRRFDHMQQHSGQHVLSAAFDRLFGVRTVSFHLGTEASTIDLEREVAALEITAAEDEANRIVWEDRPVGVSFVSAEEAARLPLRKEALRGGTLRLIDVDQFDLSACGGTHVARTGTIGIIVVTRWERFKGGQRLEFQCGGRALARFRVLRDTGDAAARLLSIPVDDLPSAVDRLQREGKELRASVAALQADATRRLGDELASSAEQLSAGRLVLRAVDGDASTLKLLASSIVARPGFLVVLVSTAPGGLVLAARSTDVAISASAILQALTLRFGGRGGGKPDLAQGGGLTGSPDAILEEARRTLDR